MSLRESLERFYLNAEERYYHACDYVDGKLRVPIYKYYVEPIESRRIPSFPVTLGIFLVIIAAIAFVALNASAPTSLQLRVTVQSADGERIQGALLEVLDTNNNTLASANTSENGFATFPALPSPSVLLRVSKDGFTLVEKDVDLTREQVIRITLESSGLVTTPTPSATPPAFSTPIPTPIPIKAALATPLPDVPLGLDSKSKLTVTIRGKNESQTIPQAHVKVYNSLTDAVIAEDDALNGYLEFPDLTVGAQVYLSVRADGYAAYQGKSKPFSLKPITTQSIELDTFNAALVSTTKIRTVEPDGNTSVPAHVWVVNPDQTIFNESESTGEAAFALYGTGQFAALAYKSGYLPARKYFTAGRDVTLTMTRSNSNNSANLRVRVTDISGQRVNNASVSLYTSYLEFLFPPKSTKGGEVSFPDLPKNDQFLVRASLNQTFAESLVSLNDTNGSSIDLVLEPLRESITASAVQAGVANATIPDARIEFWQRGANISNCTQSGNTTCRASLYVGYPVTIKAYAEGYLPGARMETLYKGEPKNVQLGLVNIPLNGVLVTGPRVKDVNGDEVSFYTADSTYTFEYTLVSVPGVDQVGFYARVGKEASVNGALAAIYGFNHRDLDSSLVSAIGSTSYSSLSCNNSNLTYHDGNGDLFNSYQKWIELGLRGAGPYVISVKVQGFPSTKADQLSVFSRGWSKSIGFNGTEFYNRTPDDPDLGMNWTSSKKPWCNAKANETVLDWNCGLLGGQACKSAPYCAPKLQKRGESCLNPEVCGPTKEVCTGNAQCCQFGDSRVCQEDCQTPIVCDPACTLGQYCDDSSSGTTGRFGTCRDCTTDAVKAGLCSIECGGENQQCCPASASSIGAGCNPGLTCGGWQKSESCNVKGVTIDVGAGNQVAASCSQVTMAVNARDGEGSVRFDVGSRCSGLTYYVRDADTSAGLSPSCFELNQSYLYYHGNTSLSCGFRLNANGTAVLEKNVILRYDCPNYNERFTDLTITLVDSSQKAKRVFQPTQVKKSGGMCITADQTWKYRRAINVENPSDLRMNEYPVAVEFDSYQMVRDGKMRIDASDLRVVTEGGMELPYTIDTATFGSQNQKAKLWIPVDLDAHSKRSDIYLLYGNAKASPVEQYELPIGIDSSNDQWTVSRFDNWNRACAGSPLCDQTPLTPAIPAPDVVANKTCTITDPVMCGGTCHCEKSQSTTETTKPDASCVLLPKSLQVNEGQYTYSCSSCKVCGKSDPQCDITDGNFCGNETRPALVFYQYLDVPTGVELIDQLSGGADFDPGMYKWQLFGTGIPSPLLGIGHSEALWSYTGDGKGTFTLAKDEQVDGKRVNRLVWALTVLSAYYPKEETNKQFTKIVPVTKAVVNNLRFRISRGAIASLGAEQTP